MYISMHNSAGDLTALGWLSFALYVAAASLSARAAMIARSHHPATPGGAFGFGSAPFWLRLV